MRKSLILVSFFVLIIGASNSFAAKIEAEAVTNKTKGVTNYTDKNASGRTGVKLSKVGDAISFTFQEDFRTLKVNYKAEANGQLTVQVGKKSRQKLYFPKRYGDHVLLDFLLGNRVKAGTNITFKGFYGVTPP